MFDRAEFTVAGAFVPENHKGGGSAVPAFAEVRTLGAGANGMQLQLIHKVCHFITICTAIYFYPDPGRQLWSRLHLLYSTLCIKNNKT
jgi:hypothetical protein